MITFRKVSKSNYQDIINLSVGKPNEKYIVNNSKTLLKAIFNDKLHYVKAIYLNQKAIGLIFFFPDRNGGIWISRFMIDNKFQGKGYGNQAFKIILNRIIKIYSPKKIELSSSNPIAVKMYQKHGFKINNQARGKKFYQKYREYLMQYKLTY